ncbi:SSI family serine proteinase inhibitor [Streptomyces olivoreticuli]
MRFRSALAPAFSAVAVAVLAAAPAAAENCPATDLQISVSHAGINPKPSWEKTVRLKCNPPGGTHENPAAACFKLREIEGNLNLLKTADSTSGVCTLQYEPVTVQIEGTLKGKNLPHPWRHTYGNPCLMHQAAGDLFLLPSSCSCSGREDRDSGTLDQGHAARSPLPTATKPPAPGVPLP